MTKEITVYTDDLGKIYWRNGDLIEARRSPDEEEGFTIPITITSDNIISEIDEDIIDVKK